MRDKNGFTLIELLAVIVILGVIMMIAIPAVTGYITQVRKDSFITTAKQYITTIKNNATTSNELPTAPGESKTFGVCNVELEKGGQRSSFGADWECEKSFVAIEYDGNNYSYEVQLNDKANNCIALTNGDDLTSSLVSTNCELVDESELNNQSTSTLREAVFQSVSLLTGNSHGLVEGNIGSITFTKPRSLPQEVIDNSIDSWDVSAAQDGSIITYVVDTNKKGKYKDLFEILEVDEIENRNDTLYELYDLYIVSTNKISLPENSSFLFSMYINLMDINNLNFVNTGNVTNMYALFGYCASLTSIDLSNFDTSKVTNMSGIFSCCINLISIDVSNFDTSKVTDMSHMFEGCKSFVSLDLSNFDTSKVTDMSGMLQLLSLTSLDLSNFDTSNVTDMHFMFWNCENLLSLDLSCFDVSKVTAMNRMFYNCKSLTSLDLSNFDTSNVRDMESMFALCADLKTIYVGLEWNTSYTGTYRMFEDCGTDHVTLKA